MNHCGDCAYSVPVIGEEAEVFLECHRVPPTPLVFEDEPMMLWPQVASEDWCGEWKAEP